MTLMKKELVNLYKEFINEFVIKWLKEGNMEITPKNIKIAKKLTNFHDFMEWLETYAK